MLRQSATSARAAPRRGLRAPIGAATTFLLSMAVAAMGLHTNLRHVFKAGLRPLALGLFASAFISVTVLVLITLGA